MNPIHEKLEWLCLTPDPGHYLFGYYDRCPWNADNTKHLALKVGQCEKLPERGETAEVGYVTPDGKGFVKLTETRAWCHQQGCMSLWLKHRSNCFVYNDYDTESDRLVARIFELGKGVVGQYDLPIYAISPDGHWAASLNFARIPRRGYSYADAVLPLNERHPDLDNDGISLLDLHTGKSRMLVSYRQIVDLHPVPYELEDNYWWMNHIIFNCDSSKLLFLFRHCSDPLSPHNPLFKTFMYTVSLDGSDLCCTLPDVYWTKGLITHQIWGRTPNEVLVDANWRAQGNEYVVFDDSVRPVRGQLISHGQGISGHLVFSPDGEWMLADTYPKVCPDGTFQTLGLVKVSTGECRPLGRFHHERPSIFDLRCDLHPRWSADGKLITVDSNHSGERKIYQLRFDDNVKF